MIFRDILTLQPAQTQTILLAMFSLHFLRIKQGKNIINIINIEFEFFPITKFIL